MKLNIIKEIPAELLHCQVCELHQILGGPTLIDLDLGKKSTLFLSTLLHGNEHSGFYTIQKLFNEIQQNRLQTAHSLLIFIGNTEAAQINLRHLPSQLDFNRVWSGGESEESRLASEVLNYAKKKELFCSVDLHNNTGKNPFYSCINKTENEFLALAHHFFEKIVYFIKPHEVQSMAFSKICPSVTLEVGKSNDPEGIKVIYKKLLQLFCMNELSLHQKREEMDVYHTVARIKISNKCSFDFNEETKAESDFSFVRAIEELNFTEMKGGQLIAYCKDTSGLSMESETDGECLEEYFYLEAGELRVKKPFIPSMLTKDHVVIKSDCLGYAMERFPLEE